MRWLLLILCAGCRFSWSAYMGAPPRATNDIKLALYAADETAATMAHSALQTDPHVTLLDVDAKAIDKDKLFDTGCAWATAHGAEYFASATVDAKYSSQYECTKFTVDVLAKHEECLEGHETNQMTVATYSLDVIDAKTCKPVRALSVKLTGRGQGEEEQSRPVALHELAETVRANPRPEPDQAEIGGEGRVVAEEPQNGYFALYRDGAYRGYVRVTHAGTDAEQIRPLYCCSGLEVGDVIVQRGLRKFLDLALTGDLAYASRAGTSSALVGGAGVGVRHYALDGGLQFGVGGDLLARKLGTLTFVTAEVGWGIRIAPGFVVSGNLGGGWAHESAPEGDTVPSDSAPQLTPRLRLQTFLATWWYAAFDVGYVVTGAFRDLGQTESTRVLIGRLNLGFDL